MEYNYTFHGYDGLSFEFEGHPAYLVFPKEAEAKRRFALKTEYWDAFAEAIELSLLEKGFHLCYIKNDNRWGTNDVLDRQARFVTWLAAEYSLSPACVPVGMSCGGLIAIKLAARWPRLVSCLYLDAPVVNFMSCPCGFGKGNELNKHPQEILSAYGYRDIGELLACRDMPLDHLGELTRARIPAALVAGDSDVTVPFDENGIYLQRAYADAKVPLFVAVKPGCDHHPHGLAKNRAVLDFILEYA